jgi:hypothetical protein
VADDAGVRIRLLGGFKVTVGDRPVAASAWRLRKAKTLVELLAVAGGHRIHREAWRRSCGPSGLRHRPPQPASGPVRRPPRGGRGSSGGLFCLRDGVVPLSEGAMPWLDTVAFEAACQRAPADPGS